MVFWEKFIYHQNTLKIFSAQYLGMFAVQVARSRKWMLEAHVTLNCGSDESTSRILSLTNHLKYLPLPLLIFKLEYVYLIWCFASLIVRNGAIQVGQYVIGNAAEVSLKLSGVAGDESGCYRAAVFKAVSFFRK